MLAKLKSAKKAVAAVVGFVAEAVASGVLTGTALHWAQAILAVATVVGVYQAKNEAPAAPVTPVAAPDILGKA